MAVTIPVNRVLCSHGGHVFRLEAEQRMVEREAELLQEAAQRERSLLQQLEELMEAVPAALQAMQEEAAELHSCLQVRPPTHARTWPIDAHRLPRRLRISALDLACP